MMRRVGVMVVAVLVGCGDDSGGGNGGDGGTGSDSGGGSDSSGVGGLLFTGTGCEGALTYTLGGDEKITLYTNAGTGLLRFIFLADGPFFDPEDETAWQTYAATHDTVLAIAFSPAQPLTVHAIDSIFDSFFGGRNLGVVGFAEHQEGEMVNITAIDTTAKTISVTFTLPVWVSTPEYSPPFNALVECRDTTPGSITGGFSGTYEIMSL
jgi:hypothetical protein